MTLPARTLEIELFVDATKKRSFEPKQIWVQEQPEAIMEQAVLEHAL